MLDGFVRWQPGSDVLGGLVHKMFGNLPAPHVLPHTVHTCGVCGEVGIEVS